MHTPCMQGPQGQQLPINDLFVTVYTYHQNVMCSYLVMIFVQVQVIRGMLPYFGKRKQVTYTI